MYICVTDIDFSTKTICTEAPMRTGPSKPELKGLVIDWEDQSTWPVELSPNGTYLRAPRYYGWCDDDADTNVSGVLEVLEQAEWMQRKRDEFYARRPFSSWVWDEASMTWSAPVAYPEGAAPHEYRWNESTLSWILQV